MSATTLARPAPAATPTTPAPTAVWALVPDPRGHDEPTPSCPACASAHVTATALAAGTALACMACGYVAAPGR